MRMLKTLALLIFVGGFWVSCDGKKSRSDMADDPMKSEKLTQKALALSWEFLERGQALADKGIDVEGILKILPDSAIVQINDHAILFFIEGSVPMLIGLPGYLASDVLYKGGAAPSTSAAATRAWPNYMAAVPTEDSNKVNVLASKKGEELREEKKALILAPFSNYFGNADDALAAKASLETNKNYEGRVDYFHQNLNLAMYDSFAEYDIVHLSTHALRFCNAESFADGSPIEVSYAGDSNYCKILINTGIEHTFESKEDMENFLSMSPEFKDYMFFDKTNIYLKNTYFDYMYGEGLEDKILIFSACELGQRSDLQESIANILTNGHFFYWSNTVDASNSYPALEKFYKNLVNEGLDADRAFEKTPAALRSQLPSSFTDSISTTTSLLHLQTGDPQHGIEVIEMRHPEKEDQRIRSGDFYPLVGDFGDGDDEALTLKVQLKGYTMQEFEEKEMRLGLKVDEEIVLWNKPFLPDVEDDEIEVEDLEDHEYGVQVTIADIAIPDVGDKERLSLKAYLHFDDERYSIHQEEVIIKADGIRAIVKGDGKSVSLTYDDKRRALKIETAGGKGPMYMDEAGYIYKHSGSQGWVKINMGGVMGMMGQMSMEGQIDNGALNEMLDPLNSNFFFPMVEWGIRFRMSAFEKNTNFKKQEKDCGKPEPCSLFVGTDGQEIGVRVLFEPNGRLKEMNYQGKKITYTYGVFDVVIPEANELNIGI